MTREEILSHIEEHPEFANSIMYYACSLRGTRSYWRQRCHERLEMVQQIDIATIFFTFSATDYLWPELFELLSPETDPHALNPEMRRKLMHENLTLSAWFFQHRVSVFLQKVLMPFFNVKDLWSRFKLQWRGSPHVHVLLWIVDAPVRESIDEMDDEQIQRIVEYYGVRLDSPLCLLDNPVELYVF